MNTSFHRALRTQSLPVGEGIREAARVGGEASSRRTHFRCLAVLCFVTGSALGWAGPVAVGTEAALRAALADPACTHIELTTSVTVSSQLEINRPVVLFGPGDDPVTRVPRVRLVAGGNHRILRVAGGVQGVELAGLSFESGRGVSPGGGALLVESGAGVVVRRCDFSNNSAPGSNAGGAILSQGNLRLEQCRVAANSAANGGGLASLAGRVELVATLVQGNVASGQGGGVYASGAELLLLNSTLSGNSAGAGGAVAFLAGSRTGVTGWVSAATIADNLSRAQSGGLYVDGAGAVVNVGGSIFARNFVVNNSGAQSPHDLATQRSGKINSADYNIVVKPGTTLSPYGPNDQIGVDPRLLPLDFNGGRTQTYAFGVASPARDRGNPAFVTALPANFGGLDPLLDLDQRGQSRIWPSGGRVDVGAFEFSAGVELSYRPRPLEYTAPLTPATLVAALTLPGGGSATLTWSVGGVAMAPQTVVLPERGVPQEHTLSSGFAFGATPVSLLFRSGTLEFSASTVVEVVDNAPPVITLLGGNPYTVQRTFDGVYVDPGATAFDQRLGSVPVASSGSVDTRLPGFNGNAITYTATDGLNVARAFRSVNVVDTIAPTLSVAVTAGVFPTTEPEPASGFRLVSLPELVNTFGLAASPDPSAPTSFVFKLAGQSEPLALPASFRVGTTTVRVSARDALGNESPARDLALTVRDAMPPRVVLNGNAAVALAFGVPYSDPGVTVGDYSQPVAVARVVTAGGLVKSEVDPGAPGVYVITYTATDAAGNSAAVQRTVTVAAPVVTLGTSVPTPITANIDPALRVAPIDLAQTITVSGLAAAYLPRLSFAATIQPESGLPVVLAGLPTYAFLVGTSQVEVRALLLQADGTWGLVGSNRFAVVVSDPFGVLLNNVAWSLALDLAPQLVNFGSSAAGSIRGVTFRQMLARAGESRWYRFSVPAGSRVEVGLTGLPANFDVVVYGDIRRTYDELTRLIASPAEADQRLALLGAEFAPEAYSPEAYSPEAYSPEAYSPEAYSPEAYSPEAYSPEAYSPEAYSPEAYSPEAYSPEAYSPEAYSPEAYSPEAYSPEAYAAAQQRTMVAFSASPGTVSEGVRFHTYSRSGEFYVRVRGQNGVYSTQAPFDLTVTIAAEECGGVGDSAVIPATPLSAVAARITGAPTSLIVWDRARIPATTTLERDALAAALSALATAANGVVVDVSGDPRIQALNAQADANPYCPLAKNLVAEAIRNLVRLYRQAAPGIADVTLIGNDRVIPFFRTEDEALLASEANYFPPVKDGTHSQSSLRYAQVLTQDRYGSSQQVTLATGPYDLPEIPVGRLVETAAEVRSYVERYLPLFNGTAASGTVPTPRTGFVAGYDFLADSAWAMRSEFAAGLGSAGAVTTLISEADVAPANGWTAAQLRSAFLGTRRDLSYLAGHFSTARALAADFTTRFLAREVAESSLDLGYALVLSAGCHSGYNTVDSEATVVTEGPDWAQAFARKHAIWISGTGYQYGDTDFIEYTERLLLEVARALRTGNGPVAIGRALVAAKRRYLAETPIMRGIHEKTLLELTLYGLPMVRFNLPGSRLAPPPADTEVTGVLPVATGPGSSRGLGRGELVLRPTLTPFSRTLDVVGSTATVTASYFSGADGIVSLPGEPVRPRESVVVGRTEGLTRGIGFRGGVYVDTTGFRPFTGAPATEIRGVHGRFATEVFFPVRPWNLNQLGELAGTAGGSVLNVFPAQYRSDSPTSETGTARQFSEMRFTVFYSAETSLAALSNPPALNVVASTVGPAGVAFAIEAAAAAGAGVQEVWITYTGLPGTPWHGRWQSLTLAPPANGSGIGTWSGTLPLPAGVPPGQVRFMVQAVNGFGGVVQSTNFGRYFIPGTSTLDGIGIQGLPTTITLTAPVPSGGTYRSSLPVRATLRGPAGEPLVAQPVQFRVGPVIRTAYTGTDGVALATLVLSARPGPHLLEANFAGDSAYQNSSDRVPFAVARMPTQLVFGPAATVTDAAQILVSLRGADGTPLKERTVILGLDNGVSRTAVVEITDGAGRARLGEGALAPGIYQVTATFAQPVTLPDGTTVPLTDPLYEGSTANRTVVVEQALTFSEEQAWLNYSDRTAPGANGGNQGLSKAELLGTITGRNASFGPWSVLAGPTAATVTASLTARVSGKVIAAGAVPLRVQANDVKRWRGSAVLDGNAVELNVDWKGAGGSAQIHVWIYPGAGTGPLFRATPALFELQVTLGAGPGERPAGGSTVVGDSARPWTQETNSSRVRSN